MVVDAKEASRLRKGWRGPMPVRFRVNGEQEEPRKVNLMPTGGGRFILYLNGEIRKASGVGVGHLVTLEVWFDEEYTGGPLHSMPSWFSDELGREPLAKRGWDRLPPSRQKEILRYFARLRSPEARRRNARRAARVLAGGRGRFMGRAWNEEEEGARAASGSCARSVPAGFAGSCSRPRRAEGSDPLASAS